MIISASRRTDIPACYSEWFFNRLKQGDVLVRNPVNIHQVSKISLSPEVVDGIVFWTKNPVPMLNRLFELEPYSYYFQFTLTPYGKEVEPGIPSKNEIMIPAFQKFSRAVGRKRVVWRYDPIFLNSKYTMEYHCKCFRDFAAKLGDYTEKCTVSFLDFYQNTARNTQPLHVRRETKKQQYEIMCRFSETAKVFGFEMDTCCESADFENLGISHGQCIDKGRLERIGDYKLELEKDKNQRPGCGCASSIDIGAYNTCKNGCRYCYANYSSQMVMGNIRMHSPLSPLLYGGIGPDDVIKLRKVKSCIDGQLSIFDL